MFLPSWMTDDWPTTATVALAFREGNVKADCTRDDVIMAASARGVLVVDNRVHHTRLSDLAFECRAMCV